MVIIYTARCVPFPYNSLRTNYQLILISSISQRSTQISVSSCIIPFSIIKRSVHLLR